MLGWHGEQVGMRENQMGGMKGAGTEPYLLELFQPVLESLEHPRAAAIITFIDYAKAFNRLDFSHCLRALANKGALTELTSVVASFLTSRTMSIKVGQVMSKPRVVLGGDPQGSILGGFLFNATISSFEAGSDDVIEHGLVGGERGAALARVQPHDKSRNIRVPPEYYRPGFRAWEVLKLHVLKYIDDNILFEKLWMDGLLIDLEGKKRARATRTQNLFWQIALLAESMGMKVIFSKNMLLCVFEAWTSEAAAFIEDTLGNTVKTVKSLKILDVHFSRKPDMAVQFVKKIRA